MIGDLEPATARPTKGRPRRWWIALLANLFGAPMGYAYVGAWRTCAAYIVLVGLVGVGATIWTVLSPPGIYGFLVVEYGLTLNFVLALLAVNVATGLHAAWLARRAPPTTQARPLRWVLYLLAYLSVPILALLMRGFSPVSFYSIPSTSMEPTLQVGDIIAVRGARSFCGMRPLAGDIVIYREPGTPIRWVRRAIATNATVLVADGHPIINGAAVRAVNLGPAAPSTSSARSGRIIRETSVAGRSYDTLDLGAGMLDQAGPFKVPTGSWFLMGDSRDNAQDSRLKGPVPETNICGVAFRILWSQDPSRVGRGL